MVRTEVLVVRDASSSSVGVAQYTCPSRLTDHWGRVVIREPRLRPASPTTRLPHHSANKLYSMLGAQHLVFLVTWQKRKEWKKVNNCEENGTKKRKMVTQVPPGLEPRFLGYFRQRISKPKVLTIYTTGPSCTFVLNFVLLYSPDVHFQDRMEASSLVSQPCFWVHSAA